MGADRLHFDLLPHSKKQKQTTNNKQQTTKKQTTTQNNNNTKYTIKIATHTTTCTVSKRSTFTRHPQRTTR
jgi:hypothetical protein